MKEVEVNEGAVSGDIADKNNRALQLMQTAYNIRRQIEVLPSQLKAVEAELDQLTLELKK